MVFGVLGIFDGVQLTFILICINTTELVTSFTDHSNQKEKVNTLSEDMYDMEPIYLHEN